MEFFRILVIFVFLMYIKDCFSEEVKDSKVSLSYLKSYVSKLENLHKLPRGMLDSIIKIESSYISSAINKVGGDNYATSYGLGQITAATGKAHCGMSQDQLLHPIKNLICAAKVLKYQYLRYNNSITYAVAAYNIGTPCVCNGESYNRFLNGKDITCQKRGSGKKLLCSPEEKGRFWNQGYVDLFKENFKEVNAFDPLT